MNKQEYTLQDLLNWANEYAYKDVIDEVRDDLYVLIDEEVNDNAPHWGLKWLSVFKDDEFKDIDKCANACDVDKFYCKCINDKLVILKDRLYQDGCEEDSFGLMAKIKKRVSVSPHELHTFIYDKLNNIDMSKTNDKYLKRVKELYDKHLNNECYSRCQALPEASRIKFHEFDYLTWQFDGSAYHCELITALTLGYDELNILPIKQ